jgi:transcriptional regulator with XRE-family HTH domain
MSTTRIAIAAERLRYDLGMPPADEKAPYPRIATTVESLLKEINPATGKPWTQTELGEVIGLSQSAVSDLKRGVPGKAGIKSIVALVKITGKSADWLLGLSNDESGMNGKIDRLIKEVEALKAARSGLKNSVGHHTVAENDDDLDATPKPPSATVTKRDATARKGR